MCASSLIPPSPPSPPSPPPTAFTELEMMKLWKGLYVCMWHSDKPLVQVRAATPCRCVCVCVSVGRGGTRDCATPSVTPAPRRNWQRVLHRLYTLCRAGELVSWARSALVFHLPLTSSPPPPLPLSPSPPLPLPSPSHFLALLFLKCFFSTMSREWLSIDRLRLDKFYTVSRGGGGRGGRESGKEEEEGRVGRRR